MRGHVCGSALQLSVVQAGVLLHQFDEIEVKGKPWEACTGPRCYCQGSYIPGRFSAMIVYQGMRNRPDRLAIPLPFGDRGGLVLNPGVLEVECLYGVDGSTVFQRVCCSSHSVATACRAASAYRAGVGRALRSRILRAIADPAVPHLSAVTPFALCRRRMTLPILAAPRQTSSARRPTPRSHGAVSAASMAGRSELTARRTSASS